MAGNSTNGIGVYGTTSGNAPQAGVYGDDGSPDGAYGVYGFSHVGVAVYGEGTSGAYGVYGNSTISIGVLGNSESGTGVSATSSEGYALQVSGTAQFKGTVQFSSSGVATVAGGDKTVTVTLAGITTSSIVLATIQKPQAGTAIEAAKPTTGSFTITLTKTAIADIPVGWFVIG